MVTQSRSTSRSLLRDTRGAAIEKIAIVGLFIFAGAIGVRFVGRSTRSGLECEGDAIAQVGGDGVVRCVPKNGAAGGGAPGAGNAPLNAPGGPLGTPNPWGCTGAGCQCFVAGTPVLTDGGWRSIESITAGDRVLSRGEAGHDLNWRPVVRTFVNGAVSLVRLTLADTAGLIDTLELTSDHRLFVVEQGWTPAGRLLAGRDRLVGAEGGTIDVRAVDVVAEPQPVFNLEIAVDHTYFVGALAVWAHNACDGVDDDGIISFPNQSQGAGAGSNDPTTPAPTNNPGSSGGAGGSRPPRKGWRFSTRWPFFKKPSRGGANQPAAQAPVASAPPPAPSPPPPDSSPPPPPPPPPPGGSNAVAGPSNPPRFTAGKERNCEDCRTVYSGRCLRPGTAFNDGLQSKARLYGLPLDLDLVRHVGVSATTGYLSTSMSAETGAKFANDCRQGYMYLYEVRVCGGVQVDYDLLAQEATARPGEGLMDAEYFTSEEVREEQEVSVVGGIPGADIISATDVSNWEGEGQDPMAQGFPRIDNPAYRRNDAARIADCKKSVAAGEVPR
ncbi:MAG TPA: polymorphic toxin-type HINT domain-containing protein [Polyangia bacterium]|nr:polymorphic toxin-type HINT domain-containing protein [Polyangia bacterium]